MVDLLLAYPIPLAIIIIAMVIALREAVAARRTAANGMPARRHRAPAANDAVARFFGWKHSA